MEDLVIQSVSDIKLNDRNKYQLEDLEEKYKIYLDKLLAMDAKKLKYFLALLKNRELINNQETEFEESFLIELYKMSHRKNSIDVVMDLYKNGKITNSDIEKLHRLVIKGSSDDLVKNYKFRSDNEKWVGSISYSGERCVDYMPPSYEKIEELLDYTLKYINNSDINCEFTDIFIRPFIAHALIAYIQPFGNGNTRLARVLQHGNICNLTNEVLQTEFPTPTFYLSKNYLNTRCQYRDLLKRLAVEKSNEAWNAWFIYNLYMIMEQLHYLDTQVDKYTRS